MSDAAAWARRRSSCNCNLGDRKHATWLRRRSYGWAHGSPTSYDAALRDVLSMQLLGLNDRNIGSGCSGERWRGP